MSTIEHRRRAADKVAAVLQAAGFDYRDGWHERDTRAGKLSVSTWSDRACKAIFMRFSDVYAAEDAGLCGFNPHTGKWNIHETTAEHALAVLRGRLALVLGDGV